jgi:hypothetical protein
MKVYRVIEYQIADDSKIDRAWLDRTLQRSLQGIRPFSGTRWIAACEVDEDDLSKETLRDLAGARERGMNSTWLAADDKRNGE